MEKLLELIKNVLDKKSLYKIVFSKPTVKGTVRAQGRYISVKGGRALQIERFHDDGKAAQQNVGEEDAFAALSELIKLFRQIDLFTSGGNCEALISKQGKVHLIDRIKEPLTEIAPDANDRAHRYILDPESCAPFLSKLGICDSKGRVYDKKTAKFRQINRFTEILDDVYRFLPQEGTLTVCDFCCGKSYLTFAVYYYLTVLKQRSVRMFGVDLKKDVIDFCADAAKDLGFDGMEFFCMNVFDFRLTDRADLVLSLHACDIATDVVLYNAVRLNAGVILSTPCCHHELSGQINSESLRFVTDQPILRQKLCDTLTDALRAKRLEAEGYRVTTLELVDPEETPKNVLIRAIRTNVAEAKKEKALAEYRSAAAFLGAQPYLDKLLQNRKELT